MPVYLKKQSTDEYRIYQRVKYAGSLPKMPAWQVHVLRKNLLNTGVENAGDVWYWTSVYTAYFTKSTATSYRIGYTYADWVLFDRNGNNTDAADDWTTGTTNGGTDDAEGPSDSRTIARTDLDANAQNAYAEIVVTVPSTWAGATLDTTLYMDTNYNHPAETRYELFYDDGGTYRKIALNGRGCLTNQWDRDSGSDVLANPGLRMVNIWDANGTLDQYFTPSTGFNVTVEVARNLKPGNYKLRVKKLLATTKRICVGRTRLHRQDPSIVPTDTDAVEYFPEFPMDTAGGLKRPGPLLSNWTSSLDLEMKHNSDSVYANGPNYGFNKQDSFTLTGDGADLTGTGPGSFVGVYNNVVFTPVDYVFRATATVNGVSASINGTSTVTLPGSTDLSAVGAGDYFKLTGRTDGINGGPWFEITGVNDGADTITVSPTPGTASGLTWAIHSRYVKITKAYTFSEEKMRAVMTCDWLKDTIVGRLYVASIRPFTLKETQNWFAYLPRHPADNHPYVGTRIEYIPKYLGLPSWSHKMTEPSETTGGTEGHSDTAIMQDITALIADRRVFHYDRIEQNQLREVGRILVCDCDYWNWVGSNILTNAQGFFSLGSEDLKSYATAIDSSTRTAAGADSVFSFELFVAEKAYLDFVGEATAFPVPITVPYFMENVYVP